MREWLRDTHGTFFELGRHFFLRLFDTDLITTPGQLQALMIGILSAICSLSMLVPITQFRKYVDLSALPDGRLYHIHAMSDRLTYTIFPMLLWDS